MEKRRPYPPLPVDNLTERILNLIEREPSKDIQQQALLQAMWVHIQDTTDPAAVADRMAEFFTSGAEYLREEAADDDTAA
jgi:hypothetical protein